MSEEKSAGASYLNSLKQGAAPGRALAGEPGQNLPQTEKRRSPRYRCQGSAHLRDISTGLATWSTFTDISLHGCYVEAMSVYPMGTELALRIEVNNYRVECRGTVRVVYPGLGMGISFLTMSEEARERLREMIRSLMRPSNLLGVRPPGGAAPSDASPDPSPADPQTVLSAIAKFFDERQMLSRDEFHRILRKSQAGPF